MPAATDPVGPYERWMYGPGRFYDLPGLLLDDQPSLSALAEFPHPATPSALPDLLSADHITLHPRLPLLYRPGRFRPHFLPFLLSPASGQSVMAQDSASLATLLTQFSAASGATGQIRLNFPVRAETIDTAFPTAFAPLTPDPAVDPAKPLVIVAAIDHGVPFAHQSLRTPTSTRVEFCWSQSAEADGSGTTLFGREFRRAAINTLASTQDEDALYRAAGLLGRPGLPPMPLARLQSHGAHILGTLAGNWQPEAAQVRIIAVDLPATSVWDTSGFGTDMFLLAAMHYIFDRAEKIAAAYNRPDVALIINLSYGTSGGPHDGTSLIGAAFDELIRYRRSLAPTALVMPSGNMFQDRLHARIDPGHFTPTARLAWFAPPADRTSSFVELWYPPGTTPARIKVTLTPPNGHPPDASLTIGPGAGRHDMFVAGKIVGQLEIDQYRETLWRVTIILAPSEPKALPPAPHGGLPAGIWTISLQNPTGQPLTGPVECRIQRDTNFGQGNTGARQSYFLDPAHDRFADVGALAQTDSADPVLKLRRFGGLNGMADGATALIVAGYVASSNAAAHYSSAGPEGVAGQVDLSAMTDRSPFHPGVLSSGTRTGATIAQQGTSSAAPQIARALAQRFLTTATGPGPAPDNYLSLLALHPAVTLVADTGRAPTARDRLGRFRLNPPPQP